MFFDWTAPLQCATRMWLTELPQDWLMLLYPMKEDEELTADNQATAYLMTDLPPGAGQSQ